MVRKAKRKISSKKKLGLLDKIVLILNILFAISLLLSYLSPITDPRDFWIIAILGFGYQILLVLNIVFVIYWIIRLRIYFLISAVSILIGFNMLLLNFRLGGGHLINKEKQVSNLRMMEYNVRAFYGIDTLNGQPILNPVSQLVKNIQPDIVAFAEYTTNTKRTDTTTRLLKKAINTNYYYFKLYNVAGEGQPFDSTGNAIFSKYPIINSGYVPSPALLNIKAIFADIKYENKIIRVYCVHLAAVEIKDEDKSQYLSGKVNIGSSSFIVGRLTSAFVIRSHQVELIKKHMDRCPYPYIIAGDFNDTPNSYAVNELGDGLKNAFEEKGNGIGATYYNKFPPLHIDYIFCSPQFDVLTYQAIDKKLSDHKPIVSDLKLNN